MNKELSILLPLLMTISIFPRDVTCIDIFIFESYFNIFPFFSFITLLEYKSKKNYVSHKRFLNFCHNISTKSYRN